MAYSSFPRSTRFSTFATPIMSQNARIAEGGTPRRRNAARVGMRGSSQPLT